MSKETERTLFRELSVGTTAAVLAVEALAKRLLGPVEAEQLMKEAIERARRDIEAVGRQSLKVSR